MPKIKNALDSTSSDSVNRHVQKLNTVLTSLATVCTTANNFHESLSKLSDIQKVFAAKLCESGTVIADSLPTIAQILIKFGQFIRLIESIQGNLSYDFITKLAIPIGEFVNKERIVYKGVNKKLQSHGDTSQPANQEFNNSVASWLANTSSNANLIVLKSISSICGAFQEFFAKGAQNVSAIENDIKKIQEETLQQVSQTESKKSWTSVRKNTQQSSRSFAMHLRSSSINENNNSTINLLQLSDADCDSDEPPLVQFANSTAEDDDDDDIDLKQLPTGVVVRRKVDQTKENTTEVNPANISPSLNVWRSPRTNPKFNTTTPRRTTLLLESPSNHSRNEENGTPRMREGTINWLAAKRDQSDLRSKSLTSLLPYNLPKVISFETHKINKARKTFQKVLEINLERKIISSYHVQNQILIERDGTTLLQVRRSKVNNRKAKLIWKGRESAPEKYLFVSEEKRERFYEVAWAIRSDSKLLQLKGEEISIFTGTWNMGNAPPPSSLRAWIPNDEFDIYVISTQECEWSPRQGGSCEADWLICLQSHLGENYTKLFGFSLLFLRMAVFVKNEHRYKITNLRKCWQATGIGGVIGNKGGLGVSFNFNETKLCFVGMHLAAHEEKVEHRNNEWKEIARSFSSLTGTTGFDIMHHFHHLFAMGDLNYRVPIPRETALNYIAQNNIQYLCNLEQLNSERNKGNIFSGFNEAPITFRPSYRYDRGSRKYSEEKNRTPSFCDRILWKSFPSNNINLIEYDACNEIMTSDHSPVYATFRVFTNFPNLPKQPVGSKVILSDFALFFTKANKSTMKSNSVAEGSFTITFDMPYLFNGIKVSESVPKFAQKENEYCPKGIPGPIWSAEQLPELIPMITSMDYVERQHVAIIIKDSHNEIGQGVIPLNGAIKSEPISFEIPILCRGILEAKLTVIHFYYNI
eukprot:TRINITY_DN1697_c2_g1_i1.p1 TRINITY_DN1697_c2_g1~~TRINITY_DN1697_c2_g1_i1.p1  ORF type:complete len:924 (+),score=364.06 TRINITY_DN1697_c2_g1_i1:53-2824(+)